MKRWKRNQNPGVSDSKAIFFMLPHLSSHASFASFLESHLYVPHPLYSFWLHLQPIIHLFISSNFPHSDSGQLTISSDRRATRHLKSKNEVRAHLIILHLPSMTTHSPMGRVQIPHHGINAIHNVASTSLSNLTSHLVFLSSPLFTRFQLH